MSLRLKELVSYLFKLGNIRQFFETYIEKLRQSHYCPELATFHCVNFDSENSKIPMKKINTKVNTVI